VDMLFLVLTVVFLLLTVAMVAGCAALERKK
jgi:succinate-acetate transporter protein